MAAKSRWENVKQDRKIFSEIEDAFLRKGADADSVKGPALTKLIYRWAGQELSDSGCTSDRLEMLLCGMTLLTEKSLSYMKEFEKTVWRNLWSIRNAKCIPTVMGILKILVADESTAQYAWDSMMEYSEDEMTLSVMEILCLCAERGAKHANEELQEILGRTSAMTRKEELTVAFLKTLVALHRNKPFECDLQFLEDFYLVSKKMLELGRQLVHAVYKTMDNCLKLGKLIDIFLFISSTQEKKEIPIEDSFCKNWLQRSPLHLAAIILDSEKALNCLPKNIVKTPTHHYRKDLYGCTPLHLAQLHFNKQAEKSLKAWRAEMDVTDKFAMSQKSSETATEDFPDVKYYELCCKVLDTKCGVLEQLKPMLVHSKVVATVLIEEVETLFKRLVKGTPFENAEVKMGGSMREKLKAGRLDEADIQLRFKGERVSRGEFSIAGVSWKEEKFLEELSKCLKKTLAEISWESINLKPMSVHGPWKVLRKGVTVSVDVVPVIVYEGEIPEEYQKYKMGYITQEGLQELQGELLEAERPQRGAMEYCALETWNDNRYDFFKETYFAYEWDMIDNLPASCRLAIVIAKALLQAYDWCKGDRLRVKMPITSYMIKTALFYILAYNTGQVKFVLYGGDTLMNALVHVEGKKSEDSTRTSKLKYNPDAQPKWLTDEDVDQHGEEARVWTWKIFTLIKCLTQERDENAPQGRKLKSYWHKSQPVIVIEDYGEAEYICDVCDCALERLTPDTWFRSADTWGQKGRHIGQKGRHMGQKGRHMGLKGRHMGQKGRHMDQKGRHMGQKGRYMGLTRGTHGSEGRDTWV